MKKYMLLPLVGVLIATATLFLYHLSEKTAAAHEAREKSLSSLTSTLANAHYQKESLSSLQRVFIEKVSHNEQESERYRVRPGLLFSTQNGFYVTRQSFELPRSDLVEAYVVYIPELLPNNTDNTIVALCWRYQGEIASDCEAAERPRRNERWVRRNSALTFQPTNTIKTGSD